MFFILETLKRFFDAQINDSQKNQDLIDINDDISQLREEVEGLKNILSLIGERPKIKQKQTVFNKQTAVYDVLNSVQTSVQTTVFDNLSPNERAIIFVLLNSDMKLSYEDLAAMLGKNKATVRGQVNSIKQKSEGLIEETISENSKKRVYIPEKTKEILTKVRKVRDKYPKRRDSHEQKTE